MSQVNHSFNRIFFLYSLLPAHNATPISTQQLCQRLKEEGYDVSIRTVQRDLKKIQKIVNVDSERTENGNLWRHAFAKPVARSMMEPSEALTLMITQGVIEKIVPPSSRKYLASAIERAENTLDKSNQFSR
ncbi:TPA: hypothetical protein ACX3E3_004086 [Vibrio parahaemolyticus]